MLSVWFREPSYSGTSVVYVDRLALVERRKLGDHLVVFDAKQRAQGG